MRKLRNSKLAKILSLTLALIFVVGAFAGCGNETEEETTTEAITTTEPKDNVIRNPLTGEPGYNKKLVNNRPVFVVVENHPDARPQWGLTSSDIVWEMVAEGGITRMLLMYADASRLPEKVGPIRSARHYFVDLAEGFDGFFVHFGYSPMAQTQIANHKVNNVNGLVDGSYFAQDSSRGVASEHTWYTTKEKVQKAIETKEYRTELKDGYTSPFQFSSKTKTLSAPCSKIKVAFSGSYTYTYHWSEVDKTYKSTLNGSAFVDSEGKQQTFENIIICYTDITSMNDSKGRVDFDFSEGTGVYVSNGSYTDITWKKGESDDMLKLYNKVGDELKLNVGRTYIAIMDNSAEPKNTITK